MKRNWGIGFLIICFELSNINLGLATQVFNISPIVVQPEALMQQDHRNYQEENQIKQLIENNNELIQQDLDRDDDQALAQLDQSMLSYRHDLVSRNWKNSRYGDLIKLTEDADAITVHHDLEEKSGLLAQKYLMLTALKDEMTSLNEKLENQQLHQESQEGSTMEGFKKITQEQQDKIQMLVARLSDMDNRLARFDDMLAQKDGRIAQLKDSLSLADREIDMLKEQSQELSSREGQIKTQVYQIQGAAQQTQQQGNDLDKIQSQVNDLNSIIEQQNKDIEAKDEVIKIQAKELSAYSSGHQSAIGQEEVSMAPIYVTSTQKNVEVPPVYVSKPTVSQPEIVTKTVYVPKTVYVTREVTKEATIDISPYKNRIQEQDKEIAQLGPLKASLETNDQDLKSKDDMIRWLKQMVAAQRAKSDYFKLSAQQEHISMQQVQDQIQQIKDDFAQRFKNFDKLQISLSSLRDEVGSLNDQLSQKQEQVDLLKEELEHKITEQKTMAQQEAQMEQDLNAQLKDKDNQLTAYKENVQQKDNQLTAFKQDMQQREDNQKTAIDHETQREQGLISQLQDKNNQISQLKDQMQGMAQARTNDDRLKLAQQLIDLQQQETDLLNQKSELALEQYQIFESHYDVFEKRMNVLIDRRRIEQIQMQDDINGLSNDLDQKQQEIDSLKTQLEERIANEKDQQGLQMQIDDLKGQLQTKENQVTALQAQVQSAQANQADALRAQLQEAQGKVEQLNQQLEAKTEEANNLGGLVNQYQQKLEYKNTAYNAQWAKVLASRNDLDQLQKQIAVLNRSLQGKEAQIQDLQTKDLSLSVIQQRVMDDKISESRNVILQLQARADLQEQEIKNLKIELALARQQLNGSPNPDEIEFLRTGMHKAADELKQKEDLLSQLQAEVDQNNGQSQNEGRELVGMKQQLQKAYDELSSVKEDLRYKSLEAIRLKEQSTIKEGDLQDQIKALTAQLKMAQRQGYSKQPISNGEMAALKVQLQNAQSRVDELEGQLDQYTKNEEQTGQDNNSNAADLQAQLNDANARIQSLEDQLKVSNKTSTVNVIAAVPGGPQAAQLQALEDQLAKANSDLADANSQIAALEDQLKEYSKHSKHDILQDKLNQATQEIHQQGAVINYLVDKLTKAGQKVDLAPYFSKS